ncbi:MAG: Gfo/Idh/MocA family oxidoreductase [Betaproteobacteria bacterium]
MIRFGVVGTAHWARAVHVPGLIATPGVELIGVAGRNPDKVRDIAQAHGIRAFSDFGAMLDRVDAVSLAVPPDAQPALACNAAEQGRHLLLEKPLAMTLAGARAIRDSAMGKVSSIVFFMRRFVPEIERAIAATAATDWKHARVRMHTCALSTRTPYTDSVWRQADRAALWDIGPHVLSILIPVLGPVERISARLGPDRLVILSTVHARGAHAESSMTLHASAESAVRDFTFAAHDRSMTLVEPTYDYRQAFVNAATELLSLIATGTHTHRCDAEFGYQVARTLNAAERSIRSGETVTLDAIENVA